jgi:DNA topoisomerase-3
MHTPCPNCGGVVKENYRRFCTKCEFSMSKTPGGRQFEIEEVEQLLKDRTIGPLQGFRSKMGRPFAAILRIVRDEEIKNFKLEFDFGQNDDSEDSEPVVTPLGPCPRAMAACTKWVWRMCASTAWPSRRLATSAAAASSCNRRSCRSKWPSCSTTARPTCCQASSRSARAVRSRPSLVKGKDGKISFEFEERSQSAGESAAAVADDGAAEEKKAPVKKAAAVKKPAAKKRQRRNQQPKKLLPLQSKKRDLRPVFHCTAFTCGKTTAISDI